MDILIRLMADGLMVVIFLITITAFIVLIKPKNWWSWAWRIALAGITAYAAAKLIGHFYQPETLRPFEKLGVEPGAAFLPNPGFPSDHALFASFLTLAVWFSTRKRSLTVVLVCLTLLMGLARVLALVHTPLDVLGGLLIPLIGIIWYRHARQKIVQ